MPELPEVEYTARQLRASIVGATISQRPCVLGTNHRPSRPCRLPVEVSERRIGGVRRRGKFLLH